ncbi:hypothetical protein HMPREF0307_00963 [Corynebacterium sp. DNF00584]|nr:hypothetical protein HMPREF0307_00963 [Corynebacterium sp. DNF00584]
MCIIGHLSRSACYRAVLADAPNIARRIPVHRPLAHRCARLGFSVLR